MKNVKDDDITVYSGPDDTVIRRPNPWTDWLAYYAREGVPLATGTAGAVLGAGSSPVIGPAGPLLGGGLGYAAGRQAVEAVEALAGGGVRRGHSFGRRVGDALRDVANGANRWMWTLNPAGAVQRAVTGSALSGLLHGAQPALDRKRMELESDLRRRERDRAADLTGAQPAGATVRKRGPVGEQLAR